MSFDTHANLAYSTVATAPSPASSGTSLVVAAGQGAWFPAPPFNALVWPVGAIATPANSEIVRVTVVSTDTLTITRAQESTSARSIIVGDQIALAVTAKTLTDIEANTRERLTASRTYYVRTDGSDSNTGLANTAGGAFLTIQKAVNVIANNLDLAGYDVTVQVGAGTYTGAVAVSSRWVGAGTVTILGDGTTPANCLWSVTGGNCLTVTGGVRLSVGGFKFVSTTSGDCLQAQDRGTILTLTSESEFGACASVHFRAMYGAAINLFADYTVNGNIAAYHWMTDGSGSCIVANSRTITLSGTPSFAAWAYAFNGSGIEAVSCTFSGSGTGQRFNVSNNATIRTDGAGTTYLPGNAVGAGTNSGASPYGLYF